MEVEEARGARVMVVSSEIEPYLGFRFSVIIPTLNEEKNIFGLVQKLVREGVEVIVADGGSVDKTIEVARRAGAKVVESGSGRGIQCNAGAKVASGDILLFLHADTMLPNLVFEKLAVFFSDPRRMVGTFMIRFTPSQWLLDLISVFSRFDSVFTRFGDQCIVIRRGFFNHICGFPDWSLFEDVNILQKSRLLTVVHSLPGRVTSSSRRFMRNGVVRQLVWNAWLLFLYLLGRSPVKLAEMYQRSLR